MSKPKRFIGEVEREICNLYFEGRLGTHKLGDQFDCSHSTIRSLIKRNGFKLRSLDEAGINSRRFTPDQEKEICRYYLNNRFGVNKLAKRFQCSSSSIQHAIERNGFELRTLSEATKGRFGARGSAWKGGIKHQGGYILIYKPNHPNVNKRGYVYEHRLVMEKSLGRFLKKEEVVHHVNEIRPDNRRSNLMLFENQHKHSYWHKKKKKVKEIIALLNKTIKPIKGETEFYVKPYVRVKTQWGI